MYCPKCGKLIDRENVLYCPSCGARLEDTPVQNEAMFQQPYSPYSPYKNPYEEKPSFGWAILGFLVPVVGWILYFVWMHDYPKKAKYCGIAGIVGFLFNLWLVLF